MSVLLKLDYFKTLKKTKISLSFSESLLICVALWLMWFNRMWSQDMLYQRTAWNTRQHVTDVYLNQIKPVVLWLIHSELLKLKSQMNIPCNSETLNTLFFFFFEWLERIHTWCSNMPNMIIWCYLCMHLVLQTSFGQEKDPVEMAWQEIVLLNRCTGPETVIQQGLVLTVCTACAGRAFSLYLVLIICY